MANNGPTNFNWSSGQTTPDIDQLAPGTYTVTVSDDFDCPLVSTVEVLDVAPIVFGTTAVDPVCNDGIISFQTLSGGTPPFLYRIATSAFSPDSSFTNLTAGTYVAVVQDANGCSDTTTLELLQQPGIVVDAGLDQQINLGDSIRLNPSISSLQNQALVWSSPTDALNCPGCLRPFVRPTGNTTFLLTVTDTVRGCIVTDEVAVLVDKRRRIYIPNAFSPNNDGVNDRFYVFSDGGAVGIKSFRIFDRWGGLLFEKFNASINNPRDGWDGLFNGKPLGNQVVVYAIEIEFFDGRTELFKGDVTVLE